MLIKNSIYPSEHFDEKKIGISTASTGVKFRDERVIFNFLLHDH